ncbi:hypothetical protein Trisim1_008548 [Trichoderma cf. simile WF8]|uniref:NADH-cytochrome b5 reductase 1 n=1 Tax=Trichoderma guizhouense TaxID=1491466 RepID=A0A1T3CRG9_9HYPO|nr:hypothetical protein A0O28_0099300 [Trichoderma guizhouense]
MGLKTFYIKDVQEHNRPDDIWMVIHNKVYNVTSYLEDHPGGVDILIAEAGKDTTQVFEDVGHSEEARELLEDLLVGEIQASDRSATVEVYRPTFETVSQTTTIHTKSQSSKGTASWYARAFSKIFIIGIFGGTAYQGYHHRKLLSHFAEASSKSLRVSGGQFWIGFGMASVVQALLTFGVVSWGASKLDFQEDFTSYPAYRVQNLATPFMSAPVAAGPGCQLDPQKWRKLTLQEKVKVSPNVYRFVFELPDSSRPLGLPIGQHVAIRAQIGDKMVSRSYTPTSDNRDLGHVDLLVKVYPTGVMTQHLESLAIGYKVEFRGPKGAMRYTNGYATHIGMIAGGTGITPMYQLIRDICLNPLDKTFVSLIYANNTESDILLKEELDLLASQHPQNLRIHYVLAKPPSKWSGSAGFVTKSIVKEYIYEPSKDTRLLLCGPPPMLAAIKKIVSELQTEEPSLLSDFDKKVFLF